MPNDSERGAQHREGTEPTLAARPFTPPDPAALVGTTLGGRYRLTEVIGSGGMGTVFRAQHVVIERPVAVKVLAPELCGVKDVRERFYREARIASRIRHPNVLDVLDLGETDDGRLYLVMELLAGQTLGQCVDPGPLPLDRLTEIFLEVCDGLGAAHEMGIVHRDVSPANVFLITPGGAEGLPVGVKVLDFGIAFMKSEPRLTRSGEVLGNPYYIAPETMRGGTATPAADVYSLGATMFESFAGRPPFEGPNYTEILMKHAAEDPPPLARFRADVPDRLAALVAACLQKQPAERPAGMPEVARELEAIARESGRRSRRSLAPFVGLAQVAGSGAAPWKDYLASAIGRAGTAGPESRRRADEMSAAIAELERLDGALAARREALAGAQANLAAAEQRFARALETLRAEEARLQAAAPAPSEALDRARAECAKAGVAFAKLRDAVASRPAASTQGARDPGPQGTLTPSSPAAGLDDALLADCERLGAAAAGLRAALREEQAARATHERRQEELADVRFQIDRLLGNAARTQATQTTTFEQDRNEIESLEESRSALWRRLIGLALSLAGREK